MDEISFLVRLVFQYVAGLAVERLTDVVQCREAHGFCLLILQDREVGRGDADLGGKVTCGDLPLGHHDIEINDNCHNHAPPLYCQIQFGAHVDGFIHHKAHTLDDQADKQSDQRDEEQRIRCERTDDADQADEEAADRYEGHIEGILLVEDDALFDVTEQVYHTEDDEVSDTCGKIKTCHKYDEADVLIFQERKASEIIVLEKTGVPAVFAEGVSEDISEKTTDKKHAAGSKCQVQPDGITRFR